MTALQNTFLSVVLIAAGALRDETGSFRWYASDLS
eukprot:SAG11_NODE_18051_length_501_cov_1.027363_1_plen_34_part_10